MICKYVLILRLRSGSWLPVCHSDDYDALCAYGCKQFALHQHFLVVANTDRRVPSDSKGVFNV